MYAYQYKHGDRPLEGFTIQRAAGRGGFGEVYYALSDGGREVALKVVTGYEQIELRGISQCMNLKSPHLVTIFDVKYNALGRPFVIMEYVSGPSLRQLLDEHPSGLGDQKSAFFLREMAKGLTFLHDCGIVHRDLKPGNIFYENGYVKIGDYGLSKAITTSQHSGQTVTVGTVHYMAPEIGAGKYDRSIDIYALGAVLFEMLTGVPPFVGSSPSEVLLKHLSAQPDCTGISEPFCTAIRKAMAKDPADRYQTVQEMVEAVFGAEHIQQSVSVFSPEELSIVAGRVAKHVMVGAGSGAAAGSGAVRSGPPPLPVMRAGAGVNAGVAIANPRPQVRPNDPWERVVQKFERLAEKTDRAAERFSQRIGGRVGGEQSPADLAAPLPDSEQSHGMSILPDDPMRFRARLILAVMASLIIAVASGLLSPQSSRIGPLVMFVVGLSIVGAVAGREMARAWLLPQFPADARRVRRLLAAVASAVGLIVISAIPWQADGVLARQMGGTMFGCIVPMFLFDVERWLAPDRVHRVRLGRSLLAGAVAGFIAQFGDAWPQLAFTITAGTMLALQSLAEWRPNSSVVTAGADGNADPNSPTAAWTPAAAMPNADPAAPPVQMPAPAPVMPTLVRRPLWIVPPAVRFVWLGLFAILLPLSISCFVAAGMSRYDNDIPPFCGFGVASALLSILSLVRFVNRNYFGIWNYLLRPLLMIIAVVTSFSSSIMMGFSHLREQDVAIGVFFIIFPVIVLILLLTLPRKRYVLVQSETGAGVPWGLPAPVLNAGPPVTSRSPVDTSARSPVQALNSGRRRERTLEEIQARRAAGADLLLSMIARMLILFGFLIAIGVALHGPEAIAAGIIDPQLPAEIQRDLFNGYGNWPLLMEKLAIVVSAILLFAAAVVQVFARRRGGVIHQARGVCGVFGLAVVAVIVHASFHMDGGWSAVHPAFQTRQFAAAIDLFLDAWNVGGAVAASAVFLICAALLAKPAGAPRPIMPLNPPPTQQLGKAA